MKLLLDTHVLLWAAAQPERLSETAYALIADPANSLLFSTASIWEIGVKRALSRADFQIDPRLLRRRLVDNQYEELAITGEHAATVDALPPLHRDPFDRMLVAQSMVEGIALITLDPLVAQYPGSIRRV